MTKALSIAWINLVRILRDRTAAFFMVVFPFAIILTIGSVFGAAFTPVVGVVAGDDPFARDRLARLDATDGIAVRAFEERATLVSAVERGQAEAGLIVPDGYTDAIRAGETVELPYVARPAGVGADARLIVAAVVDEQSIELRAARFASQERRVAFADALAEAQDVMPTIQRVEVAATSAGGSSVRRFDYGAAQELILFVFIVSLSASSMLIESRRLGVSRRMLSTPTAARTIVVGETLGRFAIALFQGVVIVVVTALLFGVDWGDPVATGAVVVAIAAVGTGAAMLMGSVLENANQAGSLGVFFSLVLAALGGCMVPLEVFPGTMRTLAHVTPHAWAIDAFGEILGDGAGLRAVLPNLGVLSLYAATLLALATVLFRRRLTA